MTDVTFTVLGAVRAWHHEVELDLGYPQQRAVLAALLVREGAFATLDELVDGVWGEGAPHSSARQIRTYIYRLRKILGSHGRLCIRSMGGGYLLETGPDSSDLSRFTRLVTQARESHKAENTVSAAARYADALALWTGTALAGIPGPYAAAQRTRLTELHLIAEEERLACTLELGAYNQAAAELSALVASHPLRERLCELQVMALYGAGRQADALNFFYMTSRRLRKELGVGPGQALSTVHQRILDNDPTLLRSAPAPASTSASTPSAKTTTPTPKPAQLPADLPHFTGRTGEQTAITALAGKAERTVMISTITGPAGVGKTALAVHWSHKAGHLFPDGQLYVNLHGFGPTSTPLEPATVIRGFIHTLGVRPEQIPADFENQVRLYRSLLAGQRMLVVLDNARDSDQVRPLLPGTAGCLVLVTSRDRLPGLVALDGAYSLPLDLLSEAESRDLLTHRLGAERVAAEPEAIEELIGLCARLPLALNVTVSRATAVQPVSPLASLVTQLRAPHSRMAALDGGDALADVQTVFSWSYRLLDKEAARMFRLLGVHTSEDITASSAAALATCREDQARAALEELDRAHLLSEVIPGRYSLHSVLRAYAVEQSRIHDSGTCHVT
ncbi:BTAD domain-containing putative transcriptional regulator [Streptomyces sp. NPDC058001]|uniref:AfsR/SARP family transcriptional regulator n=1 Tax=Streptomyces sp. NPDC058001 TaxID=3346300 RepID=UPI0036E2F070